MLLGIDRRKDTGHTYFLCTTVDARNNVLNPTKRKKMRLDMKRQQEQIWNDMASKTARESKELGSSKEVEEEMVKNSRPLVIQVLKMVV